MVNNYAHRGRLRVSKSKKRGDTSLIDLLYQIITWAGAALMVNNYAHRGRLRVSKSKKRGVVLLSDNCDCVLPMHRQ